MADMSKARTDPKGQLWEALEDVTAVMLGSTDHHQHMQPMAPLLARDEGAIWFFTGADTELARTLGAQGGSVHVCLVGKDHDYHACLRGHLSVQRSAEHIERFWSPMAEAWFSGKDDPNLTMLRFKPEHAEVWASTDSRVRFGWEIAKANLTDAEPDVGYKTEISF